MLGPLKRVKKCYLSDPSVPVPRRTWYQKVTYGKSCSQGEIANSAPKNSGSLAVLSEDGEEETTQESDFVEVLSEDEKKGNQEHVLEKEDFKPEALEDERETEVELENKIYCESGDANEKLNINDVEESNSDSDSQSGVEFELSSCDSSSSDSESSKFGSDSDNEEEELESNSEKECKFTELQLQSFSMIAFLLRHNLTGVAVNDELGLVKVICPVSTELEDLKCDELYQVIDSIKYKVCHYCSICHNVFPLNSDIFSCEMPNCSGLRYRGGLTAQT